MQWARTMAASGHTTLYVCYEHDHESLVMRLLSLELGSLAEDTGDHSHESRSSLRAIASGEGRLDDESDGNLELRAARARIDAYGKRLHLLASGGIRADIGDLATAMQSTGASVLFVDYLQKVPSFSGGGEVAGTHAASALKDLALGHNVLVVATSAAASRGLTGHRVRVADMRGASAIAYEADVILMVNEKHRVVSRLHRDFDPTAVERFRTQVVVSIDKNRSGPAGIDMQFRKDLAHFRFSEQGAHVEEHLVDRDDALDDARSG